MQTKPIHQQLNQESQDQITHIHQSSCYSQEKTEQEEQTIDDPTSVGQEKSFHFQNEQEPSVYLPYDSEFNSICSNDWWLQPDYEWLEGTLA